MRKIETRDGKTDRFLLDGYLHDPDWDTTTARGPELAATVIGGVAYVPDAKPGKDGGGNPVDDQFGSVIAYAQRQGWTVTEAQTPPASFTAAAQALLDGDVHELARLAAGL